MQGRDQRQPEIWRSKSWLLRCLLGAIGCLLVWQVFADNKGPFIPKGKGESCVAETDFMRRDHMRLLVHQRDETVLRELRDEPFSLSECVDCHVQVSDDGVPLRVDAEGQFCQSCHAYAAVKIDCFGCHAALPELAGSDHGSGDSTSFFRLYDSDSSALADLALYRHGKIQNIEIKD